MNILRSKTLSYKEKISSYLQFRDIYNISTLVSITQIILTLICLYILVYVPFHLKINVVLVYIILGNVFLILLDIFFSVAYSSKHFQIRFFIAFYVPLVMYLLCIVSNVNTITYTITNSIFLLSIVFGFCFFKPKEQNVIWIYLLTFYLLFSFRKEVEKLLLIDSHQDISTLDDTLIATQTYIRLFLYGGIMTIFYYLDNRYKINFEEDKKELILYKTHQKILFLQEKQLVKKLAEYNKIQKESKINFTTIYNFFEETKKIQNAKPDTWSKQILHEINKLVECYVSYLIKIEVTDNQVHFSSLKQTGVLLENQKLEDINNHSSLYKCYKEKSFIHEEDTQGNYEMASITTSLGTSKTSFRLFVPVIINNDVFYIFVFVKHTKWEKHIIYQLLEIADLVSGQLLYSFKK